jgi:energy-coupling factor transporter ATP-binding protein EcfA2
MGEPELLVLDEPSSNLDEASTETLCEVIRAQASRAGASIIATHDLARLQSVATRVIVLERGAVIADSNVTGGDAAIESVVARYRMRNR